MIIQKDVEWQDRLIVIRQNINLVVVNQKTISKSSKENTEVSSWDKKGTKIIKIHREKPFQTMFSLA